MIKNLSQTAVQEIESGKSNPFVAVSLADIESVFHKVNELVDKVNTIEAPCFGEWVSISEKQPAKTGSYLMSFGGELTIAFYKAEIKEIELPSGMALSVDEAQHCPISIYWMPLPEPPKKEGV